MKVKELNLVLKENFSLFIALRFAISCFSWVKFFVVVGTFFLSETAFQFQAIWYSFYQLKKVIIRRSQRCCKVAFFPRKNKSTERSNLLFHSCLSNLFKWRPPEWMRILFLQLDQRPIQAWKCNMRFSFTMRENCFKIYDFCAITCFSSSNSWIFIAKLILLSWLRFVVIQEFCQHVLFWCGNCQRSLLSVLK